MRALVRCRELSEEFMTSLESDGPLEGPSLGSPMPVVIAVIPWYTGLILVPSRSLAKERGDEKVLILLTSRKG
jgi:hypothetical protein